MIQAIEMEIIRPDALRPCDRDAWEQIRAAEPALGHPYLDHRFAAAAASVPGAALAVFRRRGQAVGFFPFQRRGRLIQPLGAPLSDYHGLISRAEDRLQPQDLAARLGGSLRVGGWVDPESGPGPGFVAKRRMVTDVSVGREAMSERLDGRNHRFSKNVRRMARGFERDHGPPVFTWDDRDPTVLDWIVAHKRTQYRRTHRHDVFACGWTVDLLRQLHEQHGTGFGLRVSSLRTPNGRLAAAEAALDDGRTLHLWFPTYDPAFSPYGVGTLLTRRELERAADEGYLAVDFGAGEEGYKSALAEPGDAVFEGVASGGRIGAAHLASSLLSRGPAALRRFEQSLGRRFDIINACETRALDWWAGAAGAAVAAVRKTKRAMA